MSDLVLDANAVGHVVTYIAPGFLVTYGYGLRYPGPDRPAGETLVLSVVLSLPLVAIVCALLPGHQEPTQIGYVAALLVPALVLGYGAAWMRERDWVRRCFETIDHRVLPTGSIYSRTLARMNPEATVTVELKNGQRFFGNPRIGPQHKDDGIGELYLTYAGARDDAGASVDIGGPSVIVPLSEVRWIVLSEEPTGAPASDEG